MKIDSAFLTGKQYTPLHSVRWSISSEAYSLWLIAERLEVVNALPEGLLYATDSPLDKDYIFLLNPEIGELKEIMPIAGSCIYGCKWKDRYVFESSVEPSGKYKNRLDFLLSREIGPGIQDRYVRIYCGNLDTGFKEIYKEKKDCLPYATFQFGAVKFPYGENNGDTLWFQPVAVVGGDLELRAYSLGLRAERNLGI